MASTDRPPFRFKMPHEFFPSKPQEYYPCMEDDHDDYISDDSFHSCSSEPPGRFKLPHEFFPPKPQEQFNHRMEDDYDAHYSKRSDSSMLAQAPASPHHQSDLSDEDQLLHTTLMDDDFWSTTYVEPFGHSSCHSDIESESSRYSYYSPSDSSTVAEGATIPSLDSYESDSDSDDSLFSLPSFRHSSPLPTTPANHEPESYYGPFSPANSPSAATSVFDCNRCFEMARTPVVTSCGHVYCSVCLYEWMNCEHERECVVSMRNLYGSLITPILSGVSSGFKVPPS